MSFVFAINDGEFLVVSDTKIGINENLSRLWKDETSKNLIKQLGMIKSIIVSPHIVISYAGNNIDKAAFLLNEVKTKSYDLEKIIKTAFDIHSCAQPDDIEFIIAYYEGRNHNELISIKNKEIIRNCKRAWLGSHDAYKEFMRLEQKIPEEKYKNSAVTVIDNSTGMHQERMDEKIAYVYELENIFAAVVKSGIDPSVGGSIVRVKIPEGENYFEYMGGISCISGGWPQEIKLGENIMFCQGREAGSFCCNIYQSEQEFCCYIYEDDLGIVYTDEVCYSSGLEGMKCPKLYKMDKQEFDKVAAEKGAYSCVELC